MEIGSRFGPSTRDLRARRTRRLGVALALALAAVVLIVPTTEARIDAHGAGTNGDVSGDLGIQDFPAWYEDEGAVYGSPLRLEPCVDSVDLCGLVGDPPFDELIYWTGGALITQGGVKVLFVAAAEGAYLNGGVVAGEEITFGRIRVKGRGLRANKWYRVTHPYGTQLVRADGRGRFAVTDDIGCFALDCDFANALESPVFQSFLRWDGTLPAPSPGHIGDPLVDHTVTGSPTGNNFFKIEGVSPGLPGSFNLGPTGMRMTDLFSVAGQCQGSCP